jgi:hypothetical protein
MLYKPHEYIKNISRDIQLLTYKLSLRWHAFGLASQIACSASEKDPVHEIKSNIRYARILLPANTVFLGRVYFNESCTDEKPEFLSYHAC